MQFKLMSILIIAISTFSAMASNSQCLPINGRFTTLPTTHSSCVNGYKIVTSQDASELNYTINAIRCGQDDNENKYTVNSELKQNTETVGQAEEKVYCTEDGRLAIRQENFLSHYTSYYGLNESGNLVVTHEKGVGIMTKSESKTYLRQE